MREVLFASCVPALWIITAIHILFLALIVSRYAKTKQPIFLLTGMICFGLLYDALILALGSFMAEGPLLLALSRMRYVLHGALIPLIYAICACALNLNGWKKTAVWGLTGILSVLGIADGCIRTLGVAEVAGVCRYISLSAPAWAETVNTFLTFGTVIPLMIVGIFVWIKQKTPRLFLAGFLMFAFSGLGAACLELMFYISMYGEVLMAMFFFLYAEHETRKDTPKH